ncbi:MAG: nucleoside deaminase [Azonexus sp.]|jgi:tRNA(Arg) A34 adenosine deaminase TadA|nr:nucleoside deaminase [Azonexus sp.]
MNPDESHLARAVELARAGSQRGDGGPFGAVIVGADGKVIAEGWNRVVVDHDPSAHAEIVAIRAACAALQVFHLSGVTLYASSEPCPMCLAAACWARIPRLVYANSRTEAAAIGFCDDELYDQLRPDCGQRNIILEHRPLAGSLEPMQAWADDPGRTAY